METPNLFFFAGVALVGLLINYLIIKGAVKAAIKEALGEKYLKDYIPGSHTPNIPTE